MTAKLNIHQRIAAVMETVTYIRKERKSEMKYTIVSHDAVTAKVRPALLSAGVIYYPIRCDHTVNGNRAEVSMTVRFANIDDPADCIDVQTFGFGVDAQDKGPGKAMSYAVKYALLKCLGLETGDDPDTDDIPHSKENPHVPPFDPAAASGRITARLAKAIAVPEVVAIYREEIDALGAIKAANAGIHAETVAAFASRKAALLNDDAPF
jgi:hypothetical protein